MREEFNSYSHQECIAQYRRRWKNTLEENKGGERIAKANNKLQAAKEENEYLKIM